MKKIFLGIIISSFVVSCNNEKKEDAATATSTTTSADKDELLDISSGDEVKAALAAFSKGDVDGFTAIYDDNARLYWSSGDSLVGKNAIKEYYAGRWKLIDSLTFSENIVLGTTVKKQQSPYQALGKWILTWNSAHVKYKNGKKLDFWIHTAYHYNDAGKVDIAVQYLDRHPIMEATKGM